MAKPLSIGMPAPDFSLKDERGEMVKLSDHKGAPVLLVFYPGDLTPGCTMQLCALRDDWAKFKSTGVTVFGVNHADADSHGRFKKKYTFPFPLLIDTNRKVSRLYGATRTIGKTVVIKRSVIGIGADGTVRYLKHGMPRNAEILKAMATKS